MTTLCDEPTAMFMSEALLSHAREIHRYARTYPEVFASLPAERAGDSVRKFVRNVIRMVKEMHALMLMAGYKGVARFCNREQVEAYMEASLEAIEQISARHSAESVDACPVLFN